MLKGNLVLRKNDPIDIITADLVTPTMEMLNYYLNGYGIKPDFNNKMDLLIPVVVYNEESYDWWDKIPLSILHNCGAFMFPRYLPYSLLKNYSEGESLFLKIDGFYEIEIVITQNEYKTGEIFENELGDMLLNAPEHIIDKYASAVRLHYNIFQRVSNILHA